MLTSDKYLFLVANIAQNPLLFQDKKFKLQFLYLLEVYKDNKNWMSYYYIVLIHQIKFHCYRNKSVGIHLGLLFIMSDLLSYAINK